MLTFDFELRHSVVFIDSQYYGHNYLFLDDHEKELLNCYSFKTVDLLRCFQF